MYVCGCAYGYVGVCMHVMLAMLLTKGCSPTPSSSLNVLSVKVILFSISIVFNLSIVYMSVLHGGVYVQCTCS